MYPAINILTLHVHGSFSCQPWFGYKEQKLCQPKRNFRSRTQRHILVIRLGGDTAEFHDDDKDSGGHFHALSVSLTLSLPVAMNLFSLLLQLPLSPGDHTQEHSCSALSASQDSVSLLKRTTLVGSSLFSYPFLVWSTWLRQGSWHKTGHWNMGKGRDTRVGKQWLAWLMWPLYQRLF